MLTWFAITFLQGHPVCCTNVSATSFGAYRRTRVPSRATIHFVPATICTRQSSTLLLEFAAMHLYKNSVFLGTLACLAAPLPFAFHYYFPILPVLPPHSIASSSLQSSSRYHTDNALHVAVIWMPENAAKRLPWATHARYRKPHGEKVCCVQRNRLHFFTR